MLDFSSIPKGYCAFTLNYKSHINLLYLLQAVAARQRSRYLRFARPPQEKQLIESRKKVMKEKKALTILLYDYIFDIIILTYRYFYNYFLKCE